MPSRREPLQIPGVNGASGSGGNGGNGRASVLKSLLDGSDSTVKLVTLGLVAVMGGGNFWATKEGTASNRAEVDRAIIEVHDLHGQLTASIQRQKEMHDQLEENGKKLDLITAKLANWKP